MTDYTRSTGISPTEPPDKTKLDSFCAELRSEGWNPGLNEESYHHILNCGFRSKSLMLAAVATEIALKEKPITLRGLFYRVVSAGWLPSTDQKYYKRLGGILTRLREQHIVPFEWIVDNLRSTNKPSSWSGLGDFADAVRDAYRKDFWSNLETYVHIFCEKDAIAGTISPVTYEYDVALSPIRGYVSLSFVYEIAEQWSEIEKPIFAYYVGDFDPSGFDLERDVREKLERYSTSAFTWQRLGVHTEDFADFNLLSLAAKQKDRRCAKFISEHGDQCAELDAIPPTEIRRRVREAIEQHIPQEEWQRLQLVEAAERESFAMFMASMEDG